MATTTWEQAIGTMAVRVSALRAQQGKRAMRNSVEALRDAMYVLAMQVAFRAMLLLRRWNY